MKKITEIYAFVAIDPEDNVEGIIGMRSKEGEWMPFVGADMDRVKSLLPIAQSIAEVTNREFRILRFSTREDITEKYK